MSLINHHSPAAVLGTDQRRTSSERAETKSKGHISFNGSSLWSMDVQYSVYAVVSALTDLQKPTIRTVLSGSYRPIGNSIGHSIPKMQKSCEMIFFGFEIFLFLFNINAFNK